jgi:hypothetical protein
MTSCRLSMIPLLLLTLVLLTGLSCATADGGQRVVIGVSS